MERYDAQLVVEPLPLYRMTARPPLNPTGSIPPQMILSKRGYKKLATSEEKCLPSSGGIESIPLTLPVFVAAKTRRKSGRPGISVILSGCGPTAPMLPLPSQQSYATFHQHTLSLQSHAV